MTFIERFVHLSPDGGSGSLEAVLLLALAATALLLRARFRKRAGLAS
jgi:hypothetical protein